MSSWLTLSTRWPWSTLLIALFFTIISIFFISRLNPESSLDAMLDPHDPATRAMTHVMQNFPMAEEMLILVSTKDNLPSDRSLLLDTAGRLEQELMRRRDFVTAVRYKPSDQVRHFVQNVMVPAGLLYLNDEQIAELRNRLTSQSMVQQLKRNQAMLAAPGPAAGSLAKSILQDPLRLHELLSQRISNLPEAGSEDGFFSPDGRDLLIRIEGARPPSDLQFSSDFTKVVKDLVHGINQEKIDIHITGAYAITAHNSAMIRADAIQDSVTSSIGLAIIFILYYRHSLWVFTTAFIPIAIGIICGFGIYAVLFTKITPLAAVIGGAMGGIGIDYSTHMLSHYKYGKPPAELVRRLFIPLLAACITSVIGFAVIGSSPIRLLRDFATVGSLSLAGAFIASITVLPALLTLRKTDPSARFRYKIYPWKKPAIPIFTSVLIIIPLILIGAGVNLHKQDSDLANLHPQPNPPLDSQIYLTSKLGLNNSGLMVHISGTNAGDLLQRCADIQKILNNPELKRAGIISTIGPATFLPEPQLTERRLMSFSEIETASILNNFDQAIAGSDFSAEAYHGYRKVLGKLLNPEQTPGLQDLQKYPELSDVFLPRNSVVNQALIYLNVEHPYKSRQEVEEAIRIINSKLSTQSDVTLTGLTVINQQTQVVVQRDLPRVAALAAILVLIYLIIHYQSFLLAMLAVLPTLVSLICLLAIMRLCGITLNIANLVMVPLLLGINIDFGIFAVDTLRNPEEESLEDQYRSSLRAMVTCATTAVIGFGSLVMTSIPAVQSLGWLVNVGVIGCCLGASFVLWPIVIIIARRRAIT